MTVSLRIDGAFVKFGVSTNRDTHISLGTDPYYPTGGIGNGYNDLTFNGTIDDFGFWSRALTVEEIEALSNAPCLCRRCGDERRWQLHPGMLACNYDAGRMRRRGCDFTCCPGLRRWHGDYDLGQFPCEGTNDETTNSCPHDIDFDGVISVLDLMDLLSVFGTNCSQCVATPSTTTVTIMRQFRLASSVGLRRTAGTWKPLALLLLGSKTIV